MNEAGELREVAIEQIVFDESVQAQERISEQTLYEYRDAMFEQGQAFPPPDLFQEAGQPRYYIGDGWHRLLAHKNCKHKTVVCRVHAGGRMAAMEHALGANAKHGLKRTKADRRKAIQMALKNFPELSDRKVAQLCNLSGCKGGCAVGAWMRCRCSRGRWIVGSLSCLLRINWG